MKKYLAFFIGLFLLIAPHHAHAALTDNIKGYWKTDESSGNAADATGNGFTLTNTNTVSYDAGIINNGADFGSANTNKELKYTADNMGVVTNADQSISFWVNVTTAPTSGNNTALVTKMNSATDTWHFVQYNNPSGTLLLRFGRVAFGGTDTFLTSVNQTLTIGTWYHIVYTYNDTTGVFTLYLNGSSIGTGTVTSKGNGTSNPGQGIDVANDGANGDFFSGHVDEIGYWSRALSSSEVTSLYNGGVGLQYPFTVVTAVINSIVGLLQASWFY